MAQKQSGTTRQQQSQSMEHPSADQGPNSGLPGGSPNDPNQDPGFGDGVKAGDASSHPPPFSRRPAEDVEQPDGDARPAAQSPLHNVPASGSQAPFGEAEKGRETRSERH
jgi:hypothetical protein